MARRSKHRQRKQKPLTKPPPKPRRPRRPRRKLQKKRRFRTPPKVTSFTAKPSITKRTQSTERKKVNLWDFTETSQICSSQLKPSPSAQRPPAPTAPGLTFRVTPAQFFSSSPLARP